MIHPVFFYGFLDHIHMTDFQFFVSELSSKYIIFLIVNSMKNFIFDKFLQLLTEYIHFGMEVYNCMFKIECI